MAQAATTAGALKQLIEGGGLKLSAYRDRAPERTVPPYVTLTEGLSVRPDPTEDGGASTAAELVSVDLWMPWKSRDTGDMAERYSLQDQLVVLLHGAKLPAAPHITHAVLVLRAGPRMVEEETNLVHVPISIEVRRYLT